MMTAADCRFFRSVGAFDSKLFRLQVTILLISLISDLLKRITLWVTDANGGHHEPYPVLFGQSWPIESLKRMIFRPARMPLMRIGFLVHCEFKRRFQTMLKLSNFSNISLVIAKQGLLRILPKAGL